jgi:hypothetical protein
MLVLTWQDAKQQRSSSSKNLLGCRFFEAASSTVASGPATFKVALCCSFLRCGGSLAAWQNSMSL